MPDGPSGFSLEPPPDVGAVSLPDASNGGTPFTMKASPGRLLLVYFGYTTCPDVCPTTLADIKRALGQLGSAADRIDLAMVTIDPRRDTGELLTTFVQAFVPGSHALRSDDEPTLRAAAAPFGVDYDVTVNADGSVDVGHTSFIYAVDASGHVPMQWSFGTKAPQLASDFQALLGRTPRS